MASAIALLGLSLHMWFLCIDIYCARLNLYIYSVRMDIVFMYIYLVAKGVTAHRADKRRWRRRKEKHITHRVKRALVSYMLLEQWLMMWLRERGVRVLWEGKRYLQLGRPRLCGGWFVIFFQLMLFIKFNCRFY